MRRDRKTEVRLDLRVPDGSAGFVYVSDTRFACSLDEAEGKPILRFWSPPGWPDEVNSRGVEPNVMVVRRALLEHGRRFGVLEPDQVRYGQPEG